MIDEVRIDPLDPTRVEALFQACNERIGRGGEDRRSNCAQ